MIFGIIQIPVKRPVL